MACCRGLWGFGIRCEAAGRTPWGELGWRRGFSRRNLACWVNAWFPFAGRQLPRLSTTGLSSFVSALPFDTVLLDFPGVLFSSLMGLGGCRP